MGDREPLACCLRLEWRRPPLAMRCGTAASSRNAQDHGRSAQLARQLTSLHACRPCFDLSRCVRTTSGRTNVFETDTNRKCTDTNGTSSRSCKRTHTGKAVPFLSVRVRLCPFQQVLMRPEAVLPRDGIRPVIRRVRPARYLDALAHATSFASHAAPDRRLRCRRPFPGCHRVAPRLGQR